MPFYLVIVIAITFQPHNDLFIGQLLTVVVLVFCILISHVLLLIYRWWLFAFVCSIGFCVAAFLLFISYHIQRDFHYQPDSHWYVATDPIPTRQPHLCDDITLLVYIVTYCTDCWP